MTTFKQDFLFEMGTEELPPKQIQSLAQQLASNFEKIFHEAQLNFTEIKFFGTPRRLAILVHQLESKQPDVKITKKGPAINLAFDSLGKPTPAALGFAKSCGVEVNELQKKTINGDNFLFFEYIKSGRATKDLLPKFCEQVISMFSIARPMRWDAAEIEFIRPIHWLVLMFDNEYVPAEILGIKTQGMTYGHRFHHPQAIPLRHAKDYVAELKSSGSVIADFQERRHNIHEQIHAIANEINAIAIIDAALLDEVTGLVEWPVALLADFDDKFLNVPEEALISAMHTHQKAFHLIDKQGNLLPHFIFISNIKSKSPQQVIAGNARVMRARLADAAFFYETDRKHSLESRLEKLKGVIFQKKLGDLYERSQRIAKLAEFIAIKLDLNPKFAYRAGLLAKADLVSSMVEEFPELQGVMGYYYALNDGLPEEVAMGIRGQYLPRFSGDDLPYSPYGCVVSLADRLDKLVGIFGIGQRPTGEKDPFALRRAALGVLNIIIEKQLPLDLLELINEAIKNYQLTFFIPDLSTELFEFILERLKNLYQEKNVSVDIFNAVNSRFVTKPYDFHLRVEAVKSFQQLPEALHLAQANKRVSNILKKEGISEMLNNIDDSLLELPAEKDLAMKVSAKREMIQPMINQRDYQGILTSLASLQRPVDQFFDEVMVMVDDPRIRNNRLALLSALRELFFEVADISKLPG